MSLEQNQINADEVIQRYYDKQIDPQQTLKLIGALLTPSFPPTFTKWIFQGIKSEITSIIDTAVILKTLGKNPTKEEAFNTYAQRKLSADRTIQALHSGRHRQF